MDLATNITGFHHVSLKAQNFEETVLFYTHLGFEVVHDWSLPEFQLEQCVMMYNKRINYYMEICDKHANIPTQGRKRNDNDEYIENALLHICFTVKDVANALSEAIKYGAKPLSNEVLHLALSNSKKTVDVTNGLVYSPNGEVIEFLRAVDFR